MSGSAGIPEAWQKPTPRPASECPPEVSAGVGNGSLALTFLGAAVAAGLLFLSQQRGYHWNKREMVLFYAGAGVAALLAVIGVALRIRAGARAKHLFVHGEPQRARVTRITRLARKRAGQRDFQAVTTGWDVDVRLPDGRTARFFDLHRKPFDEVTVFVAPGVPRAALVLPAVPKAPTPLRSEVRVGELKG